MRTSLIAAVLLAACGGSSPALNSADSADIVNGTPTGSSWGNVGAVMYDFNGDGLDADDWFCSSSLIAPNVVLTAAHCLEFLPADAQIYVTFAPSATEGFKTALPAAEFHFDPAYGHDQSDPHDIGVIILKRAVKGITPLKLPPANYLDKKALNGTRFYNVGYGGDVNTTGKPTITYDGVRKVSESDFMGLERAWLELHMTASNGNGGDCYGDSGGPKLPMFAKDTVVALVVTGDANCKATTKDYRVDSANARAFLASYVTLP